MYLIYPAQEIFSIGNSMLSTTSIPSSILSKVVLFPLPGHILAIFYLSYSNFLCLFYQFKASYVRTKPLSVWHLDKRTI